MNTLTDCELLREYAEAGSEAAFSEVVRRYVDFVHSTAFRLVRDAHLAQDVAQKVFLALAQNARQLSRREMLPGWLHRTARNISANIVRAEVRRHAREHEAAAMNENVAPETTAAWESLAPHLDAALGDLNELDRDALLQRYFQHKSAREMAASIGISSEAAQKRVNRATERLRSLFAKRGIAIGTNSLAALLAANSVHAAPAGAVAAISTAVFATHSIYKTTAIATSKVILMTTIQKIAITTVALAVVGITIQKTHNAFAVRGQVPAIQQDPKHAASSAPTASAINASQKPPFWKRLADSHTHRGRAAGSSSAVPFPATKMYALLKSKAPKLTPVQLEKYLASHGRNVDSLLAAFRTTGDPKLLAEALQKFPDDPQAAFEAAIGNNASSQEQRQWLDALKQSAPDNSLANYLSGLAYLKAGQTAEAVQDFAAAASKPQFQDYAQDRIQSDEEAYLSAGYPPGEAKLMANAFLASPQLYQVKEAGQSLVSLAAAYQQSGDQSSQAATLQMAANLGQRFDDPSLGATLASQLIGITIERAALSAMDSNSSYGSSGETVQQRLDLLAEQKEGIHALTAQADPLWQTLSDQDWLDYHSQLATLGEGPALQWLVSTYGQ
ncbi:MAG TPA: RNA polymerase sigma factor [Verrucomicrobiae bacterium]